MRVVAFPALLGLILVPPAGAQGTSSAPPLARRVALLLAAGDRRGLVDLLRTERAGAHACFAAWEERLARTPTAPQRRAYRVLTEALTEALGTPFYRDRGRQLLADWPREAPRLRAAWEGRPGPGDEVTAALVAVEWARRAVGRVPPAPLPEGYRAHLRRLRAAGCPDGTLDGLLLLARWSYLRGAYGQARRSLAAARALDARIGGGRAWEVALRRGELALKEEAFQEARQAFAEALARARTRAERLRARASLAQALAYLYELDAAGREAARAAAGLEELPRAARPLVLFQLAEVAARQGRLTRALALNGRAAALVREGGGAPRQGLLLGRQRAYLEMLRGRFGAAARALRRGLTAATARGDTLERLHHLRALAELAYRRGREGEALERGLELLEAAGRAGAERERLLALRFLGLVHLRWGLLEEATLYLREALAQAERMGSPRWEREVVRQLLYALERQGQAEAARRYEARLRRFLRTEGESVPVVAAADHLVLARLARERGEEDQARRDLERARTCLAALPAAAADPLVVWLRGAAWIEAAEQSADPEVVAAALDAAAACARRLGDPVLRAAVLFRRGRLLGAAGDLETARRAYEEALAAGESVLAGTGHLPLRAGYLEESRELLERLTEVTLALARRQGDPGPAGRVLRLAEALRDRRFRATLPVAEAGEEGRRLQAQFLEVLARWEAPERLAPTGRRRLYAELARLRDRYYRLVNRLWLARPRTYDPSRLDVGALRTRLGDALLVEYLCGKKEVFALAVDRRRGLRVFRLPASVRSLAGRVEFLDTFLERLRPGHEEVLGRLGYGLYRDLLEPLAAAGWLPRGRPLILVPDRILERLPFQVLLTARPPPGGSFAALPYLVRRHPLRYLTAAADLLRPRPRPAPATFLGVAPPAALTGLPGAVAEVEGLARLFPADRAWLATGAAATRERLLANPALRRARILHFATHGRASPLSWLYSGLLLGSAGAGGDPVLHGFEIQRLGLQPFLAVLSACETGRDAAARGTTGVGWGRVFLEAGAAAVVVATWPVDDRVTPRLMRRFYRELLAGQPADRALAAAVRALLTGTDPYAANPRYWAPFALVGAAVEFSPP